MELILFFIFLQQFFQTFTKSNKSSIFIAENMFIGKCTCLDHFLIEDTFSFLNKGLLYCHVSIPIDLNGRSLVGINKLLTRVLPSFL